MFSIKKLFRKQIIEVRDTDIDDFPRIEQNSSEKNEIEFLEDQDEWQDS